MLSFLRGVAVELHERARERRRKEMHKSQREIADEAGVALRTYQAFEAGRSTPQGGNLTAILRVLGLEPEAASEERAEETREEWPGDVRVFLDMMGAYLVTLDQSERDRYMYEQTRRIIHNNNHTG